jgi:hypothetical protein
MEQSPFYQTDALSVVLGGRGQRAQADAGPVGLLVEL